MNRKRSQLSFCTSDEETSSSQIKKPKCTQCAKSFTKHKNLQRHIDTVHADKSGKVKLACIICGKVLSRDDALKRHMKSKHPEIQRKEKRTKKPSFDGSSLVKTYAPKSECKRKVSKALTCVKSEVKKDIDTFLRKQGPLEAYLEIQVRFVNKMTKGDKKRIENFTCNGFTVLNDGDLEGHYLKSSTKKILKSVKEFRRKKKRTWRLNKVKIVELNIKRYMPIIESSYIPTPKWLCKKGAIINVKNTKDNKCFKWSILSALHNIEKDAQRLSHYVNSPHNLNFEGLNFPIKIEDVPIFELQNKNLTVNIWDYDETKVFRNIYKTENFRADREINLLVITNGNKKHYCWIKNVNRLLRNHKDNNGNLYSNGFNKDLRSSKNFKFFPKSS